MIRKNTSVRNFCNKFNQGLQRAMHADNIKMRIDDTTLDKSTENLINKIYAFGKNTRDFNHGINCHDIC